MTDTRYNRKRMALIGLWSLIGLVVLTACSREQEDEVAQEPVPAAVVPTEKELSIGLMASATPYVDEMAASRQAARAWSWTPPTNYYLYDDLYAGIDEYQSLESKAIDIILTKGTTVPYRGRLRYSSSAKIWKFVGKDESNNAVEKIASGEYFVYGFIPHNAADTVTIERLDSPPGATYEAGAVLTIKGIETIAADACVIIGARDGFRVATDAENGVDYDGSYTDTNGNGSYDTGTDTRTDRLRRGYFGINFDGGTHKEKVNEKEVDVSNPNYLFLLFDHLCSAVCFKMKVDGEYNALRHIRLKEIYLQTSTDDGPTKKKADVTVRLTAINKDYPAEDGKDPIDEITFTPTGEEVSGSVMYTSAAGKLLTTSYQSFMGHFVPKDVTKLTVTCTYDVYDTDTSVNPNGNLIRKDCSATNVIDLKKVIDRFTEATRGSKYTIEMLIKPTYLYMLSNPDLDNPTVVLEEIPAPSRGK